MNVQHLESVADAVATITGAPVNERLPDDVLLGADEIELVDMSPHALRQRMKHGNVYPPERAAGRARPVLHRGEPDRPARARPAARRAARRGPARGHDRRPAAAARHRPRARPRRRQPGVRAGRSGGRRRSPSALHAALIAVVVETPEPAEPVRSTAAATSRRRSTTRWTWARRWSGSRRTDVVAGPRGGRLARRATHVVLPSSRCGPWPAPRAPARRPAARAPARLELHVVGPTAKR